MSDRWKENMVPLGDYWIKNCDAKAATEGWGLFQCSDGEMMIMKIDDPEDGQAHLENDGEAYTLCCEKTLQGSKLHALALYLDGRVDHRVQFEEVKTDIDVPRCLIEN